ncbi:hypothetical protein FS749_010611 [Ceratobasidium sp. UAMH 11750]|nr:hypothetical protein FS749_010611 [Ceratobasidium sp. UAMH 11750]
MYEIKMTELPALRFATDPTPPSEFGRAHAINKSGYITSDLKPDERLTTEPPGEELAPGSSIWQVYLDEAKEQDTELIEEKNKNLDVMLLFAALFSAVLTAFLIESKKLLQQDSADLSATLLLAIAQSQQRVEQGAPQTRPLVERPEFSPSLSARWINGLWFTGLSLSLGAALAAMLAKEWLNAYISSRPRPPKSHALTHQARLRGLIRWRALQLIDFLPTMLHLSLLFFSLGLVVYLWTLDHSIAIAEAIITAIIGLFYVMTALSGATYSACPFKTQLSKYLRAFVPLGCKDVPGSEDGLSIASTGEETTNDELQALLWLMQNARDPAVRNCACQALVGLHNTRSTLPQTHADSEKPSGQKAGPADASQGDNNAVGENEDTSGSPINASPPPSERYAVTSQLYVGAHRRFRQAMLRLSQEFEDRRGMDMARYANVLPELVFALEAYTKTTQRSEHEPYLLAESSAVSALSAMDGFWTGNNLVLNADVYTLLVAAELRLVEAITLVHHSNSSPHTSPPAPGHPPSGAEASNAPGAVIDMQHISKDRISLFQLRARYSRSLARAGYLLVHHGARRSSASIQALVYLLESMRLAAQCADLNPESHLSTCFPQEPEADVLPLFQMTVIGSPGFEIEPLRVGDKTSVIAGLVRVIFAAGTGGVYSVELAAGRALYIVGPILLRQWVQMMRNCPDRNTPALESVERILGNWPPIDRKPNRDWGVAQWTLRQLLNLSI